MKFHFSFSTKPLEENIPKTARELLLEDLAKARYELETAYSGFDYVTDPELIDCYIYDINAVLKRYKFLLHQAAKLDIIAKSDLILVPEMEALPHAYV